MFIKRLALCQLLVLIFFFAETPILHAKDTGEELKFKIITDEIIAAPGKTAVFFIGIDIPEGYYIYANPKGPGTGMATEVSVLLPFKTDYREIRYGTGEKYRSEGDTADVFIYRKNTKIGVSFLPSEKIRLNNYKASVKIKVLMCGYGACTPHEKKITFPVAISGQENIPDNLYTAAAKEFLDMKEGIPVFATNDAKKIIEIGKSVSLIKSMNFSPVSPDRGISGLIEAILLGLLAGFILNFMPCVLPVVSLKILSFIENAHKSKKIIFIQGFLFSMGIITSFIILASLAAFWGYKWGALFQNQVFIFLMAAFVFAMSLSLFHVYIINIPAFTGKLITQRKNIYPDAFIKGAIATLLATPCSGPLLGGTLAWVLQRPPLEVFVVFISIGIGMALPYMVLTAKPALMKYIPKPGEWTIVFEEIMGFLLMLTALYLVWITDKELRVNLLLFLLFVAFAFWQYGKFGSIERSSRSRILAELLLVVILIAGYYISFSMAVKKADTAKEKNSFSIGRVLSNKDKGIISVIDFTADWCPNCKLVEKTVLEDERILRLFDRPDIDFMVADITTKNAEAEALMQVMGSSSIPFLTIIPPGEGFKNPACLRDIYSEISVLEGINYAEKFIKKKKGK